MPPLPLLRVASRSTVGQSVLSLASEQAGRTTVVRAGELALGVPSSTASTAAALWWPHGEQRTPS
jgi:hypothetical protein